MVFEFRSRLVCGVYYAPDDPHVTNPNQPGYVGSNQSNGSYSGSGSSAPNPPQISSSGSGSSTGSSALADMLSALQSGALGKVAGSGATQSVTPAGSNKTTTYGSTGQIIPNPTGYNFNTPQGFALMMPTEQPAGIPAAGSRPAGQGPYNFVSQSGNQWVADLGGNMQYFPTQDAAQQAYNTYFGFPNTPTPTPSAPGAVDPNQTVDVQTNPNAPTGKISVATMQAQLRQIGYNGSYTDVPSMVAAYNNAVQQGVNQQEQQYAQAQANNIRSQQIAQQLNFANGLLGSLGTGLGPGVLPIINSALGAAGYGNIPAASQQAYQQQQAAQAALPLLQELNRNGPFAPGEIPVVNAALQALGLPTLDVGGQAAASILPNGITPAMWDAMSQAAQQLVLQAWEARGGQAQDFINAINAQRPQGNLGEVSSVRYAPLAA